MKSQKLIPMAICYDFDGTLSPRCMQEYGFIRELGLDAGDFWNKSNTLAKKQDADQILSYMQQMRLESQKKQVPFHRKKLQSYGRAVELFAGLDTWFKRINAYGRKKGLAVEHYIISSGLKEILEGMPIAKNFTAIFASSFIYDKQGNAVWPAQVVNYTNKTQFLFRINKGCLDISDSKKINKRIPESEKHMPLYRMIYIGDGETDVPCMLTLKNDGGHSIAVYQPKIQQSCQTAQLLLDDKRADFAAPADYREGKSVEVYVKALIDKIAADAQIQNLKKKIVVDG
ncbi:MAG: haloacid dehalogenase-like hydrolase [Alphaproteobacteria bacterium]|nr:haloacid dehalogenase-like hydrolase [Alphaproteobacteria bacterium]